MKKFWKLPFLGALTLSLALPGACADVTWEHTMTVKIGQPGTAIPPTIQANIINQWSGVKHRTEVQLQSPTSAEMGLGEGELSMTQDFEADRFLVVAGPLNSYMSEPLSTLPDRVRLNFWPNLGSDLSGDDIPQLTVEQRRRMGRELNAVVMPFLKKGAKFYFRALPIQRFQKGLGSRGYRMTALVNSGTKEQPSWVRMAAEWWIADDNMPGDESVSAFLNRAIQFKKEAGGPTVSMWLNEIAPILFFAQPTEFLQAWQTLIGKQGAENYGFQGTPVRMFLTVTPPPAERAMGGDVRVALQLKRREVGPIDSAVFDPPGEMNRVELEPFLEKARAAMKKGAKQMEEMMP